MLIYHKDNGIIISLIESKNKIDFKLRFRHHSEEFISKLRFLILNEYPSNIEDFLIKNGKLIPLTKEEKYEKRVFGRLLTEEERQLNKLKPTQEEIQKAKNTIETINLWQELMEWVN